MRILVKEKQADQTVLARAFQARVSKLLGQNREELDGGGRLNLFLSATQERMAEAS